MYKAIAVWTDELDATLRADIPSGWKPHVAWIETPAGLVRLFRRDDDSACRVDGVGVPEIVAPMSAWWGVGSRRPEIEAQLRAGIEVNANGSLVKVRMPQRGWRRRNRVLYIEVEGGAEYAYRRRGPLIIGGSGLEATSNGRLVYHRLGVREHDFFAEDATPLEIALAGLMIVTNSHARVGRNPLHWV